jgi:hypothetical protein
MYAKIHCGDADKQILISNSTWEKLKNDSWNFPHLHIKFLRNLWNIETNMKQGEFKKND